MAAETLLKSDRPTLAVEALEDGKITDRSSAWDETRTILANQFLELRNRGGQVLAPCGRAVTRPSLYVLRRHLQSRYDVTR